MLVALCTARSNTPVPHVPLTIHNHMNAHCTNNNSHAKGGSVDEAFQVLKSMTAAGLTPNTFTYSTLINACAKGAQLSKAFATLKEMSDGGLVPNVVTWTTLIDACFKVCTLY
jgi:pentatricopeptide repeat protein